MKVSQGARNMCFLSSKEGVFSSGGRDHGRLHGTSDTGALKNG